MMLAALLLMQAVAPSADAIAWVERSMKAVSFGARTDAKGDITECKVRKSSGDKRFDSLLCPTVEACAKSKPKDQAAMQACLGTRLAARYPAAAAPKGEGR